MPDEQRPVAKSKTDQVRTWNMILFTISILGTLGGWAVGKDPGDLSFLLGTLAATTGIGEASAVRKRETLVGAGIRES